MQYGRSSRATNRAGALWYMHLQISLCPGSVGWLCWVGGLRDVRHVANIYDVLVWGADERAI